MLNENPIISKQGFKYILSVLDSRYYKNTLEQLLDSIITEFPGKEFTSVSMQENHNKKRHKRIKSLRKQAQIEGIVSIVDFFNPFETVLEIGSGSGLLAHNLALQYPSAKIHCIDSNNNLVEKLKQNNLLSNLSFSAEDAFTYLPETRPDIVLSLHACGNLTDRVIDIAVSSSANIICVPCCYGKIKRRSEQPGIYFLPRSRSLSGCEDLFRKRIVRTAKKMEGGVAERKECRQTILRDIYRSLLNYDRLLYLREKGYQIHLARITPLKSEKGDRFHNSSLRYALVGIINPLGSQ
ncbi:methyltransferase [Candidatus Woesearchaeota archaeon]|nr:methyltransferase [Candidatus Woesearchaeota archaeon]